MRRLLVLTMVLALFGCSGSRKLNNKIYDSQKQHLLLSPYQDAKGSIVKIKAQKKFRLNQSPVELREKIFNSDLSSDTLLIVESFDEICVNCSSYRIQVLYQDSVYYLEKDIIDNKAVNKVSQKIFDIDSEDEYGYNVEFSELIEIKRKMRSRSNWLEDPLYYGADSCSDGNHTLLTVIYPNNEIKALYVRCWGFEYQRKLNEK